MGKYTNDKSILTFDPPPNLKKRHLIKRHEFNDNYLNILLQKISKGKKNVFLLGDFNVDLLKYEKHAETNEFIDSLSSYTYLPYILHQNRVTCHSQTIIDNIFSKYISKEEVCGDLTSTISDHLP